ncbi:hypothetical protein [Streptomyces auratus]|uniref:Uncharacterized protein n=1 Tax=Streptomyces auratus AGR0001 TaxID=1160718 RepID=A0A8B1NC44_9ACTN|nr:hypothetical protein [Streptomyces auratus]QTZ90046.1 hypothetical protein SU9_000055 [Streptomyces auratus AGR0001]
MTAGQGTERAADREGRHLAEERQLRVLAEAALREAAGRMSAPLEGSARDAPQALAAGRVTVQARIG